MAAKRSKKTKKPLSMGAWAAARGGGGFFARDYIKYVASFRKRKRARKVKHKRAR